jgi:hypothetical protein
MSYTEARSHFEKARLSTVDKRVIEMLDGLKHLSHAIEEEGPENVGTKCAEHPRRPE